MRRARSSNAGIAGALFFSAILLAAPAAFSQVNYGDFLGTGVDFLQVTETTQTADPAVLWDTPALNGSGTGLQFFPPNFTSICSAGSSDITSSQLTTTIMSQVGNTIDQVALVESGDVTLTSFPPFGNPATNASASVGGFLTVIEDSSGPIVPVVIPFAGTFTPSSTFSLPGNFGASTWQGSFTIDVASQVPNATKAILQLNNTLDSNCAPGATSGKIQKKSVGGPTVSLLVNPLDCDLLIDKTCCVTQPSLPDLMPTEGEIVRIIFEYTGDKCHASNNNQGHAFKCYGRRSLKDPVSLDILYDGGVMTATPSSGVMEGETVEITSNTGILLDWLKIKTTGSWWRRQYIQMDTSGNRAIRCDDQFGAYKVVGIESTIGGFIDCSAPPPPPTCAQALNDPLGTPCDGEIVDMVLEYNGQACQVPLGNPQSGHASCTGDATGATDVRLNYTGADAWRQVIAPASGINDGDLIRVTATWVGGCPTTQKYVISDSGGVRQNIEFKVGCNKPLALGDEFGSFKVVEFTTKTGNTYGLGTGGSPPADSCEVPLAPPGPHCTGSLESITLVYIGDFLGAGCTVSNSQGGFATCTGVADPGDPVSIGTMGDIVATPDDLIEFGDLVTFTKNGSGNLPWLVWFDATGAGGTQGIDIKTSCQKPLSLGDRFGAWVVFAMDRQDDGPVSLGGNVQYQFAVTNPGGTAVDNVEITDSELGTIVSGVTLLPGQTQTFTQNATLFGTTTNVATATGDIAGDFCNPGTDQVTVGVTAPPPGAFSCNSPMSGFSVIWNGAQTIDINVYNGFVGAGGSLINQYTDVAPGDAVEVTGLTANDAEFVMTNSTSGAPAGRSIFTLSCWDYAMNGVEDCGKFLGNGKLDNQLFNNDWLLEGLTDYNESFECTPGLVPNPPACGFGPELLVMMPTLMWWHRRRLRKES